MHTFSHFVVLDSFYSEGENLRKNKRFISVDLSVLIVEMLAVFQREALD